MSAAAITQVDSGPIKYDSNESQYPDSSRSVSYKSCCSEEPQVSTKPPANHPRNIDAYFEDLNTIAELIQTEWEEKVHPGPDSVMVGARIVTVRLLSDKLFEFFKPGEGTASTCDDTVFERLCDMAHVHGSEWMKARQQKGPPSSAIWGRDRLIKSIHQMYESLRDSRNSGATKAATAAAIREALTNARESIDTMSRSFVWRVDPPGDQECRLLGSNLAIQSRMEGLRRRYMNQIQLTTQETP